MERVRRARTRGTVVLLAVAAAIAASCGGGGGGGNGTPTSPSAPSGGGGTAPSATVTITITGQGGRLAFNPNPASVAPGQVVVFKNNDLVAHHVTLDDGTVQTADIPPGGTSAAVAMGTSGSSTYHCTIHPGMVGGFNGAEVEPPPNCSQAYCFGGG
jgi:plastocyanin